MQISINGSSFRIMLKIQPISDYGRVFVLLHKSVKKRRLHINSSGMSASFISRCFFFEFRRSSSDTSPKGLHIHLQDFSIYLCNMPGLMGRVVYEVIYGPRRERESTGEGDASVNELLISITPRH